MVTTIEELNVDWSVFDPDERERIESFLRFNAHDELAAVLFQVNPRQAEEIAKIQRQLRPREFKFESRKQAEFEQWMKDSTFQDITPEIAQKWQDEIDAEKEQKLLQLSGGVPATEVKNVGGTNSVVASVSNDLKNVKGLGEASIKRLNAANIYSIEELRRLDLPERKKILGPLVAAKITYLT